MYDRFLLFILFIQNWSDIIGQMDFFYSFWITFGFFAKNEQVYLL